MLTKPQRRKFETFLFLMIVHFLLLIHAAVNRRSLVVRELGHATRSLTVKNFTFGLIWLFWEWNNKADEVAFVLTVSFLTVFYSVTVNAWSQKPKYRILYISLPCNQCYFINYTFLAKFWCRNHLETWFFCMPIVKVYLLYRITLFTVFANELICISKFRCQV